MTRVNNRFVLIRGLLREARHWGKFSHSLKDRFPRAEILTPDIPGNGRLHQVTSPDSIFALTEGVREQVAVREKLDLVAISMGGMIAIDWMTRHPEEVNTAIIINTSVRPCSPFYHRLRWQRYLDILFMLCHSRFRQEQDILSLTSNRFRDDSVLLKSWRQWYQQNPVSSRSTRNQIMAAAKFSISEKPEHPLLIISSKADRLVDSRCSDKLQQRWQTDFRQHDTAGHDLPLDEPDWLADAIMSWTLQKP